MLILHPKTVFEVSGGKRMSATFVGTYGNTVKREKKKKTVAKESVVL